MRAWPDTVVANDVEHGQERLPRSLTELLIGEPGVTDAGGRFELGGMAGQPPVPSRRKPTAPPAFPSPAFRVSPGATTRDGVAAAR